MPNTITTNKGRSMEEITASVRIHMRNMVNNALELGTDLAEAKEACAHGQWLPWLKSVGISSSTAANYMRIAREVEADSRVAQLPYTKILALISAPPEEREELAEMAEDMSAAEILIIAKATHAFLSQCELMVFDPGIKEEGNAILRCVEQLNEWCRNMTAALDADLVEAEAAVI